MLDILYVLSVRTSYDKYRTAIPDHVLSKEAKQILDDIGNYFDLFADISIIDWNDFESWFCYLKHSSFKQEKLDLYRQVFENLREFEDSPVTGDVVRSFIEKDYATKAADLCLKITEGEVTNQLSDIRVFVDDYEKAAHIVTEEGFVEDDILELCKEAEQGLDWRLNCLNLSFGPLRKGNLIVLGKLPESGGSAMTISECTHFLTQLEDDEVILYLTNEERGQAYRKRIVSSVLNKPWKESILKDPVKARKDFQDLGGDRIKIKEIHGKTMPQIEQVIKEVSPRVIVFDQLWKVADHKKNQGEVAKITGLFNAARVLAANYAPVIAVHQADGSAYGTKYIELNQLYMSRIGLQGEADGICTIGIDPENRMDKIRYLNICKNKLEGGDKSDEAYRHGRFECRILPEVSRFKDL